MWLYFKEILSEFVGMRYNLCNEPSRDQMAANSGGTHMAFSETWTALQTELVARPIIPNWTVHSGAIGDPFKVIVATSDVVMVDPPGAESPKRVYRKDFQRVYESWHEYCHCGMLRKEFESLWRSKYVISILHWLESQLGGKLP